MSTSAGGLYSNGASSSRALGYDIRSPLRAPQNAVKGFALAGADLGTLVVGVFSNCLDRLHLPFGSGGSPTRQRQTSIESVSSVDRPRVVLGSKSEGRCGEEYICEDVVIGPRNLIGRRVAAAWALDCASFSDVAGDPSLFASGFFDDAFLVSCTSRFHADDPGVLFSDGVTVVAMAQEGDICLDNS